MRPILKVCAGKNIEDFSYKYENFIIDFKCGSLFWTYTSGCLRQLKRARYSSSGEHLSERVHSYLLHGEARDIFDSEKPRAIWHE